MKLNNRGWGLQAMLVGVLVLMIALVIIAVLIQNTFNNIMEPINNDNHQTENDGNKNDEDKSQYKSYEEIENSILSAAKKYQKEYYSDILDGEKISVTLKNLQEEKLIGEINDIKDKSIVCSGYAIFINDDEKIIYNAYIKCGDNYETIGYQDFYDVQF